MVQEVPHRRPLTRATATADYTPVILTFGGHDSLCFSQVVENKALPSLPSKRFMVLTI
jgi:hypothetical protein